MNELKTEKKKKEDKFYVYLLISDLYQHSYIGATIDYNHRLRQHNKELVGGAIYTSNIVLRGEKWNIHRFVSGFPTWQAALQFEWRWKQISRTVVKKQTTNKKMTIKIRMEALQILLSLNQSTSKAIPYSSWNSPPEINHYYNYLEMKKMKQKINQEIIEYIHIK